MNIRVGLLFLRPNIFNNITLALSEDKTRQTKQNTNKFKNF